MRTRTYWLILTACLMFFVSCKISRQATLNHESITGKYWKLVELNGNQVQSAEYSGREPYMKLIPGESRVNGNGGCNSFFGSYELLGQSGIIFSQIGSTKMACRENIMEVEHQLFAALGDADGFSMKGDTLILGKSEKLLAKFVAVDGK